MGTTAGLAQVDSWACPQWDSSFGELFGPDSASFQAPTALVLLKVEGACAKPARVGARTQDTGAPAGRVQNPHACSKSTRRESIDMLEERH